jgi:cytochrome P450
LQFGPSTVVVVTDAEVARSMLVTDSARWSRPPAMRLPVRMGVGENLFTQSDRKWARVQPKVAPAFRGRALAGPLERLDEIVASELATVPVGVEIDLELVMGRIALVIAAWVFLGERLASSQAERLADHQREVVAWVGRRLGALSSAIPVAFGPEVRAMRVHRLALEQYVDGVIERSTDEGRADSGVIGALQSVRIAGRPLSPREVRSHILGLLLAGNETTAAALSWMLVHGARNPDEWTRLRTEPDRASAFVAEALRISPPAWGLTRTPSTGGVRLQAGSESVRVRRPGVVTVYLRGIHRDPTLWNEPNRFDPDRHVDPTRAQDRGLIAFGLGPRGCIGQHLALAELHALGPALARHGRVILTTDIEEDASFALRSKHGLRGSFVVDAPATNDELFRNPGAREQGDRA